MIIGFHSLWGLENAWFFKDAKDLNYGDNLWYPLIALKEHAAKLGITIGRVTEFNLEDIDIFVFHEVPVPEDQDPYFQYAITNHKPMYLYNYEPEVICWASHCLDKHQPYKKIFTQHDQYIDGKKYVKINPFCIDVSNSIKNPTKQNLCTLIASGNKSSSHPMELYTERMNAIEWFEQNQPNDFDFYGHSWNHQDHPCYKGLSFNKIETLSHYKFAICYENARDVAGYITEKIFDCFNASCVPIYLGANNITQYIPPQCFIDRRLFSSYDDLFQYITNMSEETYDGYLQAIEQYLSSDLAKQFSVNQFVTTMWQGLTH
ncbi:MAG TPA: glycosyltransferase family 10 [Bacillota bacterium]|nr:glycosyltransferase family 10 [Bacillota bacterium]